ncbi:hypothetical protein CCC_02646 [Paramagnetospirillum magnetotacticum MS-1]|uniref:Uncharacterized protein n=1 Tax=Paramagnetospirillum magnetotacticum MS-1 TaxID=272627 RepID=A0A0C2UEC8_PARME|nr:hypothetical protein CCC_02646 [Paramagnetospirillum magnetotacticum MS-1]
MFRTVFSQGMCLAGHICAAMYRQGKPRHPEFRSYISQGGCEWGVKALGGFCFNLINKAWRLNRQDPRVSAGPILSWCLRRAGDTKNVCPSAEAAHRINSVISHDAADGYGAAFLSCDRLKDQDFGFYSIIMQGSRERLVSGTRRFRYRNINSAAQGCQEFPP